MNDMMRLQASALMMAAYKDFMQLSKELEGDRGSGITDYAAEPVAEDPVPGMDYENEDIPDFATGDDYEDFPGRQLYCYDELDPNDPAFYSGKSIGIPSESAVRRNDRQGKLLAMMSGLFNDL